MLFWKILSKHVSNIFSLEVINKYLSEDIKLRRKLFNSVLTLKTYKLNI